MALPLRPRPFAERPKSAVLLPQPANDNAQNPRGPGKSGGNSLGRIENGAFRFASPEAEEQWIRAAYQSGVNAETWQLGDEVDEQTAELAKAGLGGPMPAVYRGPDGKHRTINTKTIETAAVRDHRNRQLSGMTMDQIAAAGKMPGEDEWVEQWKAGRSESRPGFGARFEASARKSLVDDTVFGNVIQQFASGHAVSPEVLATRPSDKFLQLGSKGMLDWYRMYEPLGVAGGKRRIDFLSPEERKQWETAWEAMPVDQQAAYRAMWEEKQKEYLPWRAKFEEETTLPPPETVAEYVAKILGSISGSMASPESWIGFGPKAAANATRVTARETVEASIPNAGRLIGSPGKASFAAHTSEIAQELGSTGTGLLPVQPRPKYDPHNLLPNLETPRLTEKDAYHLTGDDRGFAFVLETPRGKPEAIAWEEGVRGRVKDVETRKTLSPSILFRNSNKKGLHVVKFDGYQITDDGQYIMMIDAKRRFPFFFNVGAERDTIRTFLRWLEALDQNPNFLIVVEFPTITEVFLAQKAFRLIRLSNRISARVRPDE